MNIFEKWKFGKLLTTLNISKIDALTGVEFEEFICNLFDYLGYQSSTTAITGDNGIDVLAKSKSKSIGIQTKLYYNHNVGNKAIQEVFSGKNYYKLDFAIACTNWNFSAPAINLANELKVGIIDRKILTKILNNSRKENIFLVNNIIKNISN
jgi:restriction system protein